LARKPKWLCGRSLWEAGATGAAQELIEGQGHQFLFIVMSGVAPTKGDLVNDQGNESMVGDGDAMGVVA